MGVSGETVRRWAADYYILLTDFDPSDIDDELIDKILESSRGKSIKNPHSLIRNDEFCKQFVKSNAYRKGEPNMTVKVAGKQHVTHARL